MRITIDIPDNKENGFVLDRVLNAVFPDKPIMRHFDDVKQIMEYHTSLEWRTKLYKMVDCHDCKHHGEDLHGENCRFCHNKSRFEEVNPQEPKVGHWIVSEYKDEIYTNIATCSLCNAEVINNGVDQFCPNCGAKMAESEGKNENG